MKTVFMMHVPQDHQAAVVLCIGYCIYNFDTALLTRQNQWKTGRWKETHTENYDDVIAKK